MKSVTNTIWMWYKTEEVVEEEKKKKKKKGTDWHHVVVRGLEVK